MLNIKSLINIKSQIFFMSRQNKVPEVRQPQAIEAKYSPQILSKEQIERSF
jgi:hypothetical protein